MERPNWALVGAVLLLVFVLAWGQFSGVPAQVEQIGEDTSLTCEAVNRTNRGLLAYINRQLNRAEKATPTLAYYRAHPVELGRVLATIQQQRKDAARQFGPVSC